jgi:hypothetical protein
MGNGDEEIHVGNPVWGTGNAPPSGPINRPLQTRDEFFKVHHRRWAR